ncbi:MAG TPA: TetR/AcrR family transcriptional regulator [Thermoanaerobaculia bacterium]|nr:TetR/AcrR family transcriptional regulator [Thermoanaerobaculia bacterium]
MDNKTPYPISRTLLDEAPVELSSHDRILLSARTLFSSQGYENATTSAIARMAGTSESQLIKHFGSKEGLLAAIFDQSWQRVSRVLAQVLAQCETPFDRLLALADVMIGALEQDKDLRTLMLLEGRRIRKHGSMVVLTDGFLNMVATLDGLLEEMRAAGQLQPGLNVQAIRSALIGAFEGLLRDQILAERGNYPASYSSEDLRAVFRLFLNCFGPDE